VISTLGCCPRATLLGGPMTFTKCKAEPRYHLVPYFGNPNPQTWAATYTEPITFEFCTQHYIISLGNPPQLGKLFYCMELQRYTEISPSLNSLNLSERKIKKKLFKNLTRLTIPDIKLFLKKFRRKKR
jgi:hypothetical protein